MITLEPECLVHVLEEAPRGRDEDVHSREALLLVLEALSADDESGRELVLVANLAEDLEDLDGLRTRRTRVSKTWLQKAEGRGRTSSRVGLMMRAPRPSVGPHFFLRRISRTGTRKARVFPLPVLAAPRTSFPWRARGRARAWMSVSLE